MMTISVQSSSVVIVLVIIALVSVMTTNASIFDYVNCGVIKTKVIANCGKDFRKDMSQLSDWYELRRRQVCCSLQRLRHCVVNELGNKCHGITDEEVNQVFDVVVKGVALVSNYDCKSYGTSSWMCAPGYVFIIVAVGLLILMLATCYYCFLYWYRRRGGGSGWCRKNTNQPTAPPLFP
ncbi:uncharacterized protein LOC128961229 [Oppia nitens]|uniref:uncharacterized protein LOC128961229 n=1 Tax=Oppia nitens TaxID=1686743 RepID=UPI0023DB2969|nr:uncharacterized protein LOC128961229 [Oppia nitens]